MKSKYLSVTIVILSCVLIIALSSCSLTSTDASAFTVEKKDCITDIDLAKSGPDIVVPGKVGTKVIRNMELFSPHFSKIDSLDLSKVSELEKFDLDISYAGKKSKLKKLDFSKNENLISLNVNDTNALEEVIFNKNCKSITLAHTDLRELNLKSLKGLDDFVYFDGPIDKIDFSGNTNLDYIVFYYTNIKKINLSKLKKITFFEYVSGPLEELDISNNPNLEGLQVYGTNVKVLDISKNHKLRFIQVDEGTQIIGEINPGAEIRYWTKEDVKELRSKLLDD